MPPGPGDGEASGDGAALPDAPLDPPSEPPSTRMCSIFTTVTSLRPAAEKMVVRSAAPVVDEIAAWRSCMAEFRSVTVAVGRTTDTSTFVVSDTRLKEAPDGTESKPAVVARVDSTWL